jgi:hypothetical protein
MIRFYLFHSLSLSSSSPFKRLGSPEKRGEKNRGKIYRIEISFVIVSRKKRKIRIKSEINRKVSSEQREKG